MRPHLFGQIACICGLLLVIAQPVEADSAFIRSLLLPGSGQAHRGYYGRATLFASVAVISGIGIYISQIHYNRASERYNDTKREYLGFEQQLSQGEIISYEEIIDTYQDMQESLDQAESRYRWRNVFLVSFIGSYALNLVDMMWSGRATGEEERGLTFEMDRSGVRIVKTVRF